MLEKKRKRHLGEDCKAPNNGFSVQTDNMRWKAIKH